MHLSTDNLRGRSDRTEHDQVSSADNVGMPGILDNQLVCRPELFKKAAIMLVRECTRQLNSKQLQTSRHILTVLDEITDALRGNEDVKQELSDLMNRLHI